MNLPTLETKKEQKDEKLFQQYNSSRISMRLLTKTGRPIIFAGYSFITSDQDLIEYLDEEIKLGLNCISKGEAVTSKEADPMSALKDKHIAEYKAQLLAEKVAAAKGEEPDMGTTNPIGMPALGAASSRTVAN